MADTLESDNTSVILSVQDNTCDPSIRDAGGKFVNGHQPVFFGFKPGQNHGGAPKTSIKNALDTAREHAPELIQALYDAATKEGNTQAAIYLLDRVYGRPSQQLQHDMSERTDELLEELLANRGTQDE